MKHLVHITAFLLATALFFRAGAEDFTVRIGDSEEKFRRVYGRPSMGMDKGPDMILMYKRGEVTLRDGKVVSNDMPGAIDVGSKIRESRASDSSYVPVQSKQKTAAGAATRPSTSTGASEMKKWDSGPVPDYPTLSRMIRKKKRNHDVSAGQEDLRRAIDLAWTQHTQGGNSPFPAGKTRCVSGVSKKEHGPNSISTISPSTREM